jgi:hypothetical protein
LALESAIAKKLCGKGNEGYRSQQVIELISDRRKKGDMI